MQYTASIVLFSTLIAKLCFANLTIETSEQHESLVEATIEILESCYADRFDTVGIAGRSAGSFIKSVSSRKTVISTASIGRHNPFLIDPGGHKLHVFVVTLIDTSEVAEVLMDISWQKWGNPIGSFLIIDSAEKKNGCSKAYEVLSDAWVADLLNAKFICFDQTRGRLIYTFNPYTNDAPSPWRQVDIYEGFEGHNWTLFVRNYDSDDSRCDELDFDKTVDLGGYPIYVFDDRISGVMNGWGNNRPVRSQWLDITDRLLEESMNARWVVKDNGTLFDDNTWYYDVDYDMRFPISSVRNETGYTYPIVQNAVYIMTRYRGHKSPLDKLISVLDKSSRFGVLAVLTITLFFFKFWMREPLIDAVLNLVRPICNSGLRGIPRHTAPRIYLTSLFILVVTIQGIYSGKLATLLTKNVRLPTVDSWEDVFRYNITLRIPLLPGVEGAYVPDKDFFFEGPVAIYPSTQALSNAKEARVGYWIGLIDQAVHYKYHLSREAVAYEDAGYVVRENWPLVERVNTILGRLVASGIPNFLHAKIFQRQMRILKSYELEEHEPELKPLSLEHLGFAFKILAIGLGLATMVFIVELATKDWN